MISLKINSKRSFSAKQKIAAAIGAGALLVGSFLPVLALTEQGVAATVTVQNISVSVGDGVVQYGTLDANTSKDTTSSGVNDSQIATNNGNVAEDFNIKGSNSGNWTLSGSSGTDQYVHEFCRNDGGDCDGTPVFTALTTSYTELDTSVSASGTQDFDLKITTPTSSTNFSEQNVNVTVQAVIAL